jgi:hypothetical protein
MKIFSKKIIVSEVGPIINVQTRDICLSLWLLCARSTLKQEDQIFPWIVFAFRMIPSLDTSVYTIKLIILIAFSVWYEHNAFNFI